MSSLKAGGCCKPLPPTLGSDGWVCSSFFSCCWCKDGVTTVAKGATTGEEGPLATCATGTVDVTIRLGKGRLPRLGITPEDSKAGFKVYLKNAK